MVAERVENFIRDLIKKTESGKLKWKIVERIDSWDMIKKQIEKVKGNELKDYFINDAKSYAINKCEGYVMILNVQYGNAPVFSDALDKYILFVKLNDESLPQNLSEYDFKGYKDILFNLVKEIETKENEAYDMPNCLYNFFDKILEEDTDGRIIDK